MYKPTTYLYLIRRGSTNDIKIGISKCPPKRLRQLQTASSDKLILLAYFYVDRYMEKRLHKMFFLDKKRGEWYNLSPSKLEAIVDYLLQHSNYSDSKSVSLSSTLSEPKSNPLSKVD